MARENFADVMLSDYSNRIVFSKALTHSMHLAKMGTRSQILNFHQLVLYLELCNAGVKILPLPTLCSKDFKWDLIYIWGFRKGLIPRRG